jgi:hypothetical protein
LKDKGRPDYTLNPTTRGPTNGVQFTAGAVQSLMAGYYQNSVMLQRDLLEVSFLLDYFCSNKTSIVEWRGCTESERNKKFGAYKVRTALDDRDGFTERKREEH